jgi:poly(A) polymerase
LLSRLKKLFKQKPSLSRQTFVASAEGVQRRDVSPNALKVIELLQKKGFEAYIVGGGVRDLLLGEHPKDFDIATNAHPEEIRKIFRNCRLIGRRFRLAHIYFEKEILEVATFRSGSEGKFLSRKKDHHTSKEGLILRDNLYGTLEEDAFRRDFSLNALYYDPVQDTLIDFTGGLADLRDKSIRLIGNPTLRYQEDPVRILRALRFLVKLDAVFEKNTEAAIFKTGQFLANVSSHRLYEEMIKLTHYRADKMYLLLKHYELLTVLFPALATLTQTELTQTEKLFLCSAQEIMERHDKDMAVSSSLLWTSLFWQCYQSRFEAALSSLTPVFELSYQVASDFLRTELAPFMIPKQTALGIIEVWRAQLRFAQRDKKHSEQFFHDRYFNSYYDFLVLRAEAEEENAMDLLPWWETFIAATPEERNTLYDSVPKKRRKRRKKPIRPKET